MNGMKSRFGVLVLVSTCLVACGALEGSTTLVIEHANVIDGTGLETASDRTLIVRDGYIVGIGPSSNIVVPSGAMVIDATDKYVIPGLWEMHAHTDAAASTFDLYLANGVTGIRDMGCAPACAALLEDRKARTAANTMSGPRLIFTGPNIDGASPLEFQGHAQVTVANAADMVAVLEDAGADAIKVRDWLSLEEYRAVLEAARTHGLPVDGHIPAAVSALTVAESGQRTVEHGGSVLGGLLLASSSVESELRTELLDSMEAARASGDFFAPFILAMSPTFTDRLVQTFDKTKADAMAEAFRRAGTAVVPTLVVGHPAFRSADPVFDGRRILEQERMQYVPAYMADAWAASGAGPLFEGAGLAALADRYKALVDLVVRMHQAGVPILAGTDLSPEAPWQVPGFSLHDELLLLVEAGLTPLDAIRAATAEATKVLGLEELGTVEAGMQADLVILDADPLVDIRNTRRISGVIVGGDYLDRSALDGLLETAAEAAAQSRR
jgi:imidazolonepropionase-like amidohydrolase